MPQRDPDLDKRSALQATGTLHPHPAAVIAPLFQDSDFFDPADLVQVKYEMLRRVLVDHGPVTHSARPNSASPDRFFIKPKRLSSPPAWPV